MVGASTTGRARSGAACLGAAMVRTLPHFLSMSGCGAYRRNILLQGAAATA